jgi:NAD(P)-dependent dehydrogenase (short-subunit alcohol dehydrogenase family)
MTNQAKITGNMFSEKPLKGQHALITGGSRGIGAAISNTLAKLGANISLTGRTEGTLNDQAGALRVHEGVEVFTATGDMSSEADVEKCFAAAAEKLGPVNILINNAGIGKSAPFHRMDTEFWNQTIGLNLTGTYLCTKQVYGTMREAGYGRIVNISSTVGLRGYPYIAAYCASKHGVIGLTRTLALEAVKTGITVNAICPGYTDTDLVSDAVDSIVGKTGRDRDEIQSEIDNMSPMGRMVAPEEVAETVAWICLPSSASITGQAIVVAGGAVMN